MTQHRARLASSISGWIAPADVEDLLQEAFLRAMTRPPEFRGSRSTYAWFRRLLRNLAIDHIRHENVEHRARAALARDRGSWSSKTSDVEDERIGRELFSLLDEIEPRYAEVVRRIDFEDRSIDEVARDLGLTKGNVRVRLHRARSKLRSRWSERRST